MHAVWTLGAKGFVFDKDGTLIDTEFLWYESCRRLLEEHGARHDIATHQRMMGGGLQPASVILQDRHRRLPRGEEWGRQFVDRWRQAFTLLREELGVCLMPGVGSFIEICRKRGISLAVATSGHRHDTDVEFRALNWTETFHATVTVEDVVKRKPAPDIYLEAARRLFLRPDQCVAFEDSPNGVASAHAAGMKVVFIRDERFGIPTPPEATMTVSSFLEMLQ